MQYLSGNVLFQFDSRHRFVRALGDRRERTIQGPGRVDDHAGGLDLVHQRRIEEVAAKQRLQNADLAVRLDTRRKGPENIRRIEDINVIVEDKDVFGVIERQRGRRGAARIAFGHFFHRDKDIVMSVAALLADGGYPRHRFPAAAQVGAFARLAPGVTLDALRAELESLGQRLAAADPTAETLEGATSLGVLARPLSEVGIDPGRRRSAVLLFGAVWLVLAVACLTLAALQLSRSRVRARELAVRTALGAGRGRLVRQLLTEGALLGLLGCAVGLALAFPGARLLQHLQPVRFPSWGNLYNAVSEVASIALSPEVLTFALGISLATAIVVSHVPALRAWRPGDATTSRPNRPELARRTL